MNGNENKVRRPMIYFASPLFSRAELVFNEGIVQQLERHFNVYLPQRDGGLMGKMIQDGVSATVAAQRVFKRDVNAMLECDAVLAVLDGRTIDEGVAFEIGFAFAHSKRCVGLQTDVRRLRPEGNNPMIEGSLEVIFPEVSDFLNWATDNLTVDTQLHIVRT